MLGFGEKGREFMKKKTKYSNGPIGNLKVVDDFLPSPDQLAFKEDNVKVTISLKKSSIAFFKREAEKNDTQYQKMIRELLDIYANKYQGT